MRRSRALAPSILALALCPLAGCGSSHDTIEQQLSEMRSEVVKLRADNAVLAERLDGVELRGTPGRGAPSPAPAAAAAPKGDAPDLQVVKLAPDAPDEAAEPLLSANDKPVVIRGTGSTATIDGVPSKPASSGASPMASDASAASAASAAKKSAPGVAAVSAKPPAAGGGAAMSRQSVKAVSP